MESVGRVEVINRYPVKSLLGEQLGEAELSPLGIAGDRRLALRDLTTGKILSAKVPKLGIPLLTCRASTDPSGAVRVTVGSHTYDVGDAALDAALRSLLGRDVRVEGTAADTDVYASEWPAIEGLALSGVDLDFPIAMSTGKGAFVDLAALHVVTTSSMQHLATLAPDVRIAVDRFRPSFVIESDGDGFVENGWPGKQATVGSAVIEFTEVSPRCVMTTLPQGDLAREPGVLQAMATHNRREVGGFGNFACLGVYAEVVTPGTVRVGDEISF